MKQFEAMAIKSCFLTLAIFVSFSAKSQISMEHNTDKEVLYVYEGKVIVDSIPTLTIFRDYSFSKNERTVYLAWSSFSGNEKTFYMNSYEVQGGKLNLIGQHWIRQSNFERLFRDGLAIKFMEEGLELSFKSSLFSSVILSYSKLNLDKLPKVLAGLSKFD